jgi:2,4-dienoyl-CoA reductase-like NADH-dependent reductase (Old Yellow Enzyme family)
MSRNEYRVFSEGNIAGLTLKNRLVRSATSEAAMTGDGKITDGMFSLYKNLAEGGVGMIITGFMAVMPEGKMSPKQACIWDDGYIAEIARIGDVVHGSGNDCKILAQLVHAGRQKRLDLEYVGPSAVPSALLKKNVRALSASEVRSVIKSFSEAIVRVKKAGFDGAQLHGAHGYLLSSFLSPYTNRRTDHFGSSIKNRVNIIREIVSLARETVGDFPVLIKMNCDDFLEGGINIDTFPELAMEVENSGVDAIEISGGMWDCLTRSEEELGFFPLPIPESRTRINTRDKQSYFLAYAERLNLTIPVILVGGNKNVEHLEEIILQGKVEFFSLCRPLICEPDLPNRWLEGKGSATCKCLSCNLCLLTLREGPVHCLVKAKNLKHKGVQVMTPYLWKPFSVSM